MLCEKICLSALQPIFYFMPWINFERNTSVHFFPSAPDSIGNVSSHLQSSKVSLKDLNINLRVPLIQDNTFGGGDFKLLLTINALSPIGEGILLPMTIISDGSTNSSVVCWLKCLFSQQLLVTK